MSLSSLTSSSATRTSSTNDDDKDRHATSVQNRRRKYNMLINRILGDVASQQQQQLISVMAPSVGAAASTALTFGQPHSHLVPNQGEQAKQNQVRQTAPVNMANCSQRPIDFRCNPRPQQHQPQGQRHHQMTAEESAKMGRQQVPLNSSRGANRATARRKWLADLERQQQPPVPARQALNGAPELSMAHNELRLATSDDYNQECRSSTSASPSASLSGCSSPVSVGSPVGLFGSATCRLDFGAQVASPGHGDDESRQQVAAAPDRRPEAAGGRQEGSRPASDDDDDEEDAHEDDDRRQDNEDNCSTSSSSSSSSSSATSTFRGPAKRKRRHSSSNTCEVDDTYQMKVNC